MSARPDEDGLIARYFRPLATAPGAAQLLDDAAAYQPPPGHELVLTTDAIVAGVHFFPGDPADAVAKKALRVNLSDLAAKGATPVGYLLTIALTELWSEDWFAQFCKGLGEDQKQFGISLYGGDTVRTPGPLFVSVTAFGLAPLGKVPRRTGAKAGQKIYVTGTIGDAALGLKLRLDPALKQRWGLDGADMDYLDARYLVPEPRIAMAGVVAEYAAASMDVSDGLAGDLARMCGASNTGAVVDAARVPLSAAAAKAVQADPTALLAVLTGGDDYEVLAAVDPARTRDFEQAAKKAGLAVSGIGAIVEPFEGRVRVERDGQVLTLEKLAFRHF
jgi:thiamine-monophosphate kinase